MKKLMILGLMLAGCATTPSKTVEKRLSDLEEGQACLITFSMESKIYLQLITADPKNIEKILELQYYFGIVSEARKNLCSKNSAPLKVENKSNIEKITPKYPNEGI